jgi:catechol 2,3-dioxygenase-like lactoylglutathione lyase family enzyme
MIGHHASIRTADIHRAIAFYQVLGFSMEERFTTGETLACWLRGTGGRIELIQIPQPAPPPDAFGDPHFVGYYHLSFDLSTQLSPEQSLSDWVAALGDRLAQESLSLNVLLPPQLQRIGEHTYEVAFLADADGLPLEVLRSLT